MNLVIVESPAKGKTIEKYLGGDYKVAASYGHVRDLPIGELGVDVEKNFTPKYVIPTKARKNISNLKNLIKSADRVYLATDYDREGEAIAWHIVQAIGLQAQPQTTSGLGLPRTLRGTGQNYSRITFTEITKDAIKEAITKPRDIDIDLVNAQQARRILDRLVGYKLSPFLWKKIYKGLSAGRVQSVAVRLIVEREREIENFKPQEYWTIAATLLNVKYQNSNVKTCEFQASLAEINDKKLDKLAIKSKHEADAIITHIKQSACVVANTIKKEEKRWPYPPFTTSTLQQEASYKLGFSAKKTMKIAQDLYEDGKITYMRTDSTNLSSLAINSARKYIDKNFGSEYMPENAIVYKTKSKGAQEAHEAIRPTDLECQISNVKSQSFGDDDHSKLYDLIWRRTIACQMTPMILNTQTVYIDSRANIDQYKLQARGTSIKFDGFSKVWPVKMEEKTLPKLEENDALKVEDVVGKQHFTEPPARYSEASLIKALEEKGIGRPSTYAPTISTILERKYVELIKRYFHPMEAGFLVTDLLLKHFPDVVDIGFTANMEENLDEIAEGKKEWTKVLGDFYFPFEKNLNHKYEEVNKSDIIKEEKTDIKCEKCGQDMVVKMGRFGKFLACSGFPKCKNTKPIIVKTGIKCPECQKGDVVERKTKKGKTFWGCERYPECKWATWDNPAKKL